MSFAGLETFLDNLKTLTESEAFKNADKGAKMEMGYRLLNSPYGVGHPLRGGTRALGSNVRSRKDQAKMTEVNIVGDVPDPSGTTDVERWRDEGRREILKDIAAIEPEIVIPSPDGGCTICRFCHSEAWVNGVIDHESGCLWIRARTATGERP